MANENFYGRVCVDKNVWRMWEILSKRNMAGLKPGQATKWARPTGANGALELAICGPDGDKVFTHHVVAGQWCMKVARTCEQPELVPLDEAA